MSEPIPDPNPIDKPDTASEPLREDEFIGTTGDEDSAWEEDDAQWGADEDPLKDVDELQIENRIDTADQELPTDPDLD